MGAMEQGLTPGEAGLISSLQILPLVGLPHAIFRGCVFFSIALGARARPQKEAVPQKCPQGLQ